MPPPLCDNPLRAARNTGARIAPRPALLMLGLLVLAAPARTQQPKDLRADPAIGRMVDGGMVEALEARLPERRGPAEYRLLTEAYRHRLAATDEADRELAVRAAERLHREWVEAVRELPSATPAVRRGVLEAEALHALGDFLLTIKAAPALDRFLLTNGAAGRSPEAVDIMERARTAFESATGAVERLEEDRQTLEDRLLAEGLFDLFTRLQLDARFGRASADLQLARMAPNDAAGRSRARSARGTFDALLEIGLNEAGGQQCQTGRGAAALLLADYRTADRALERALHGPDPRVSARARILRARALFGLRQFDAGRKSLAPLLGPPPQRNGDTLRFYHNLARLWHANAYLLEAQAQSAAPRKRALRERGLLAFHQLGAQSDAWRELVSFWVRDVVRPDAPPERLSAIELLYAAQSLAGNEHYAAALSRLDHARRRGDLSPELLGEILYTRALTLYQQGDLQHAAESFAEIAERRPAFPRAADAAIAAWQLQTRLAQQSGSPARWRDAAKSLRALEHLDAQRARDLSTAWRRGAALQRAQDYEAAAGAFADVPADSPQYETARLQELVSRRLALQHDSRTLENRVRARIALAEQFQARAAELRRGGAEAPAAQAWLHAAELYASPDVEHWEDAREALRAFDGVHASSAPEPQSVARALALRVRIARGAGDLREAAEAVRTSVDSLSATAAEDVLTALGAALLDQVRELTEAGQQDTSRALARDALEIFARLEAAVADNQRKRMAVRFGRARLLIWAGRSEQAVELLQGLRAARPENGAYQLWLARARTAALSKNASRAEVTAARDAWAALLRDGSLKQRDADVWWEARYNVLDLTLRSGDAKSVISAIEQQRVWDPDLGGSKWAEKLAALEQRARAANR